MENLNPDTRYNSINNTYHTPCSGLSKKRTSVGVNRIVVNNFSDYKEDNLTEPRNQFLVNWYLRSQIQIR